MSDPADDSLLTRRTLLSRLRNLDDQDSWRTFFNLYWRLLYNVARKSGLDDGGAQEIVQDTVIAVARKMPEFRYDPARGTQAVAPADYAKADHRSSTPRLSAAAQSGGCA